MDSLTTGKLIKKLRTKQNLTQSQLAFMIGVSDKTVSKWETGRGIFDISLIEPLSKALNVSIFELISGNCVTNKNKSANIQKARFCVCPVCGNIIYSMGENINFCCGVNLSFLKEKNENEEHLICVNEVENELYVSINHSMEKNHYISFVAFVNYNKI